MNKEYLAEQWEEAAKQFTSESGPMGMIGICLAIKFAMEMNVSFPKAIGTVHEMRKSPQGRLAVGMKLLDSKDETVAHFHMAMEAYSGSLDDFLAFVKAEAERISKSN